MEKNAKPPITAQKRLEIIVQLVSFLVTLANICIFKTGVVVAVIAFVITSPIVWRFFRISFLKLPKDFSFLKNPKCIGITFAIMFVGGIIPTIILLDYSPNPLDRGFCMPHWWLNVLVIPLISCSIFHYIGKLESNEGICQN